MLLGRPRGICPWRRTCRGSRSARRRPVGDDVAGGGDGHVGALVLEAAQRGVLARGGVGSNGSTSTIQPKRLVSLACLGVRVSKRGSSSVPAAGGGLAAEAVALVPALLSVPAATRSTVEVLLAGEDRAPRGGAAGAVAQGAEHLAARGVGRGLDQVGAGGRSGQFVFGVHQEPAVQLGAAGRSATAGSCSCAPARRRTGRARPRPPRAGARRGIDRPGT